MPLTPPCLMKAIGSWKLLCAFCGEDASRRHRLAVHRFDDAHLVRADLDQRNFMDDALKGIFDQVQAGLQDIRLNADFALCRDDASRRHLAPEVTPLLDRYLFRADVNQYAAQDDDEHDEQYEPDDEHRSQRPHVNVVHDLKSSSLGKDGYGETFASSS